MKHVVELWLVRHGETTSNSDGLLAGWSDVPLTLRGEAQARLLRNKLEGESFINVWSSDLVRAMTTARLAYGEPTPDKSLREINFGDLEGFRWDEIDTEYQAGLLGFKDFTAPGGEDLQAFEARVHKFLNSLSEGRHLIFTHGGVIRMLTRDLDLDRFVLNGTLVAVDWTKKKLLFIKQPSEVAQDG